MLNLAAGRSGRALKSPGSSSSVLTSLNRMYPNLKIRSKSDFTVYDSIKKGLDLESLVEGNVVPTSHVGEGGQYTKATTPPKFWAPLDFEDRILEARDFVEHAKQDLKKINAVDGVGSITIDEESNEAEVRQVWSYYVLHPIERALQLVELPETYRVKVRLEFHPEEGREVRVDVLLQVKSAELGRKFVLAALEMKNYGVISSQMKNIMAAKVDSLQDARRVEGSSALRFRGDSKFLFRQCAAYASRYGIRHVGMCDLSMAIYLEFKDLGDTTALRTGNHDKRKGLKSANETKSKGAKGGNETTADIRVPTGNFVLMHAQTDLESYHYALLGFFKRALDDWVREMA